MFILFVHFPVFAVKCNSSYCQWTREPYDLCRMSPKEQTVSLIVTARNEAEDIEACLRSLMVQEWQDTEVILVDNSSTDGTPDIARRLGVRVEDRGPERSAQRNHGANNASGSYLCFLDADMQAPPSMTRECVELLQDSEVGAVVIPEESFGEGFWTKCKILERSCYPPGSYIEAARFFRRDAFEKLGGFDEHLTGLEDLDLHQRCAAAYKIAHSASPIRHHEGDIKFFDQVRKKYRYGLLSHAYARKHPAAFRKQGNPFRGYFLRNWKRLIKNPGLSSAMLFMKTSELLAGGYGVLIGFISNTVKGAE